eukprot:6128526-Amphidinium_carterae.1
MDDPVLHPEEAPGTWGKTLREYVPPEPVDLDDDTPGVWGKKLRDYVPPEPVDLDADTLVSPQQGQSQDDLFILTSSLEDGTPKEIKQELIDQ